MPNHNPAPRRPANTALAAVAALMTAAPAPVMAAPVPVPVQGDGTPTEAACRAFGFDLSPPRPPQTLHRPMPAPPPAVLTVQPTKKEDRLEYAAPSPPPPPPPPPPPGAMVNDVTVSGSRIAPRPPGVPAPPSADTERYPDATPNPVKRTAEQPVSTFSIDVDTVAYANVRRFIDNGGARRATPFASRR